MKRFLIVLTSLLAVMSINAEKLTGTRSLDHFSKITATNGANLLLRKSTEEKVEVIIENGLLSDVSTVVSKGNLKVKVKAQINKELSVLVIVYYIDLRSISASNGAAIETKDVLLTEMLDISTSTGGEIKAEIECTDIKASATGGGEVTLYGWCERLEAKSNTKAMLDAKKLKADRVLAKAATGGEIWVYPKDYLEAVVNTAGKIYYTNTPTKINEKISSGGEIIKEIVTIGHDLVKDI